MPFANNSRAWLAKAGIFVLAAGVASLLFINWCHLVYQCGCRSWWNGAAAYCNIHAPEPPHCPWCTQGGAGGFVSFGLIVLSQALAAFWPGASRYGMRLLLALAAFPAIGGVTALFYGWLSGYWAR